MATGSDSLPKPAQVLAAVVCDLFLDHSQTHHSPDTFTNYRHFLRSFCQRCGRTPAAELKPFHVTRWLDAHPKWKGARRHAIVAVKRAFAWAEQEGLIVTHPLRTLKAGRAKRRTRVLSPGEIGEIMAAIRDQPFRDFVRAMLETGCRPSEVARVTAAEVNLAAGVWAFAEHKTAKKTHKPRVVYLTPHMVELSRALIAKRPDGPLFRVPRGTAFTRQAIRCRFRRLRAKLPHLKPFVCYNLRHTFATQPLVNGVGVAQVAELLGHTSTEMVSHTYGHLAGQVATCGRRPAGRSADRTVR